MLAWPSPANHSQPRRSLSEQILKPNRNQRTDQHSTKKKVSTNETLDWLERTQTRDVSKENLEQSPDWAGPLLRLMFFIRWFAILCMWLWFVDLVGPDWFCECVFSKNDFRMLMFAIIIMLILLFMPQGLLPWLRDKLENECPRCKIRNVVSRRNCRVCDAPMQ